MKYPVKYFCGPGLQCYTQELIGNGLKMFNEQCDGLAPIVGETGIDGLLIDFNCGLRLQIPEGDWHVRIVDARSELVFLDDDLSSVTLLSMEKFYIEWEIALWLDGEPVFYHQFDPHGQRVHFRFMHPAIGDNISLLPYVEKFRRAFDCEAFISISSAFDGIIKNYLPRVRLIDGENKLPDDIYATFFISGWMNMPLAATDDIRSVQMELFGSSILGTSKIYRPPKVIYTPTEPRAIEQKYVCIGVQASTPAKGWLNPDGWDRVGEYLKSLGYKVLLIDRECSNLIDCVNQLAYADFFIGVSSGPAWLAWAADIPVVLISGISEPWCEFDTPYRVYNPLACHGCFNDLRADYRRIADCIHHHGTPQAYECSKNISAQQVIDAINRLIADHNLEARRDEA